MAATWHPDDRWRSDHEPASRMQVSPASCSSSVETECCAEPAVRKSSRREHYQTSVKNLDLKDIVLTTSTALSNSLLLQIVKNGKRISLVPHSESTGLKQRICSRCIWFCLTRSGVADQKYLDFITDITKEKLKDAGSVQKVREFLKPKLVLFEGLHTTDLPPQLKDHSPVMFSETTSPQSIVEFIEGRYNEQVHKVEQAIRDEHRGPFLYVYARAKLETTVNKRYLDQITILMEEAFDDASSYPRQLLMQLYKMVNARVVHEECKDQKPRLRSHEICIELRPNHLATCLTFNRACIDGTFAEMVRTHIKINGNSFIGTIEISIAHENFLHILQYFQPLRVSRHRIILLDYLEQKDIDECEDIFKNCEKDKPQCQVVPNLKTLTATNIYMAFLRNLSLTPYAFLKQMKSLGCPDMLDTIRCTAGYNAMHWAILAERIDFLRMLFYANKWGILSQDVVQPMANGGEMQAQHKGYIPRRLAEALSYKSKGYEVLCEFDKLNSVWRCLCPVMKASLAGSVDYVNTLVESRPYLLHLKDGTGANCLFYACASGNTKLVSYLIAKQVPRNVQNENGESALHIAAMFGHTEILKVLAKCKFDIRGQRNKSGKTAIDYCAMNGDIEVLTLYKEMNFPIDPKALTLAAKNKQTKAVEFLVTELNPNQGQDDDGRLALHYEVINGNMKLVEKLLKQGADVGHKDLFGKNVVHLASEFGHDIVLRLLLKNASREQTRKLLSDKDYFVGKDLLYVVRGKDRGRKAWHWVELKRLSVHAFKEALHSGQIDVARYGRILKSGFGPGPNEEAQKLMKERTHKLLIANGGKGVPDMTPLHVAVLKDSEAIASFLLEKGTDPNAVDSFGATPVHYVAMTGNVRILQLLEERGSDLNLQTKDKQCAKDIAEENKNVLAANFILAKPIMEKAKSFSDEALERTIEHFKESNLSLKRNDGTDLKRYVIDTLRELTISINETLQDLGSGPIQEASEGQSVSSGPESTHRT